MLVDILSDTHFDSHFSYISPSEDMLKRFWHSLKPKAKTLVIAGDIGHHNQQNINILKGLKEHFYENIILVFVNHDYYIQRDHVYHFNDSKLQHQYRTSSERITEFKHMVENIKGVHLLDGDMIEIEDVKFAGTMGWYDGKYHRVNRQTVKVIDGFNKRVDTQALWDNCINDSDYIVPKMKYNGYFESENAKIEALLLKHPDVMITHIMPSIKIEHQNQRYYKEPATSFFCYDGSQHLSSFNGKYWIFGHSHFSVDHNIDGRFKLVSNCLGYRGEESKDAKIKSVKIEINE